MATKKESSGKIDGKVTRVANSKVFFRPDDLAVLRTLNLDASERCHRAGHDEIAVRVEDADAYKVGDDASFDVA